MHAAFCLYPINQIIFSMRYIGQSSNNACRLVQRNCLWLLHAGQLLYSRPASLLLLLFLIVVIEAAYLGFHALAYLVLLNIIAGAFVVVKPSFNANELKFWGGRPISLPEKIMRGAMRLRALKPNVLLLNGVQRL